MYKLISVKVVLDRILRDDLFSGLSLEAALDYFVEFVQIVGIPSSFIDKYEESEFENYRTILPCDFIEVNSILVNGIPAKTATDAFITRYGDDPSLANTPNISFKIENDIVYFSKEKGKVLINYKAIAMIDDFPAIPNDAHLLRALKDYIEYCHIKILYRAGKVPRAIYEDAEQSYSYSVGAYSSNSKIQNMAQMETISNVLTSILHRSNAFKTRFSTIGTRLELNKK